MFFRVLRKKGGLAKFVQFVGYVSLRAKAYTSSSFLKGKLWRYLNENWNRWRTVDDRDERGRLLQQTHTVRATTPLVETMTSLDELRNKMRSMIVVASVTSTSREMR